MTLLVKRTLTGSASGVTSQITENARRSTPDRSEQMSSVSGLGSMSMRRCTRYVVVALPAHKSGCACLIKEALRRCRATLSPLQQVDAPLREARH